MPSHRSTSRFALFVAAALAGVAALPGSSPAATASPRAANPFLGARLYVDPYSNASRQAEQWRQTRPADAAIMDKIATQPQASWFGDWGGPVRADVAAHVTAAQAAGAVPVLVAYDIPRRDCGGHSSGGASSPAAYRRWIRDFAAGLGQARVVVVVEPDAVAGLDCLSRAKQRTRLGLLNRAVSILRSDKQAAVYIDAGNQGWQPARTIASRLRAAGVRRARGFSLNVSNFDTTAREIAYGKAISTRIGRKSGLESSLKTFVVDTSRNGVGPTKHRQWCNPPKRALGAVPTGRTGNTRVDAFLWIKPPGESDGKCNGGPAAGTWWPEYALALARRAAW
jgi:endoglucanase